MIIFISLLPTVIELWKARSTPRAAARVSL
jgi:hypothetical protein